MRPQKPATAAPARLIARSVDAALLDRHWPDWRAETEPNILVAWLRAWHAEEEINDAAFRTGGDRLPFSTPVISWRRWKTGGDGGTNYRVG